MTGPATRARRTTALLAAPRGRSEYITARAIARLTHATLRLFHWMAPKKKTMPALLRKVTLHLRLSSAFAMRMTIATTQVMVSPCAVRKAPDSPRITLPQLKYAIQHMSARYRAAAMNHFAKPAKSALVRKVAATVNERRMVLRMR